jgi:hypothetical protein
MRPGPDPRERRLAELVAATPWLMQALDAVRSLGLASWCIGAGAIRGLVWDHLHGFDAPSAPADVDVVFFDADDASPRREQHLKHLLDERLPALAWEVVNQAAVHHWYATPEGRAVEPLRSLEEGIASWPEYATCVGVFLDAAGVVRVIAPHGLADLFDGMVRWNPIRVPPEVYLDRVARKRFAERWPQVKVMPVVNAPSSSCRISLIS